MIIMTAFFDIKFLHWGYLPECKTWVGKHFDYYVLDFAESGTLTLSMDNSPPVKLDGPVAWLTFPGPLFQFGKKSDDDGTWKHRYVAFYGPFGDELVKRGIFTLDSPIIPVNNPVRFKIAFDELLNYLGNPAWGMDRAANMLEGLLLQLHEQKQQSQFEQMDNRIKQLVEKIRRLPSGNWDFIHEAKRLSLSYSHFRKLFHDGMNQSPTLFLIGVKMELAARLLKEEPLPTMTEIAERCGYDDIYYFNKSFKKYHSISPGRYRKQSLIFK
jgi:AraC-like DNA-binding protein